MYVGFQVYRHIFQKCELISHGKYATIYYYKCFPISPLHNVGKLESGADTEQHCTWGQRFMVNVSKNPRVFCQDSSFQWMAQVSGGYSLLHAVRHRTQRSHWSGLKRTNLMTYSFNIGLINFFIIVI